MATSDQSKDKLAATVEETKAAVLDLQKFLKAEGTERFVRSCTSCLADSCNKELAKATAAE